MSKSLNPVIQSYRTIVQIILTLSVVFCISHAGDKLLFKCGETARFFSKLSIILFYFSLLLLTACDSIFKQGHYEGILFEGESISGAKRHRSPRELVNIEVVTERNQPAKVQVKDVFKNKIFSFQIEKVGHRSIEMSFPSLGTGVLELKKVSHRSDRSGGRPDLLCFYHSKVFEILLCIADHDFQLTIKDADRNPLYILSGGAFNRSTPFELEEPKAFTLEKAIQVGLEKNFSSRIEFEYLCQAHAKAKTAYLNLLPHLRLSTFMAIPTFMATLNPYIVVNEIGNLAPFALPNRWHSARKAKLEAEAQDESYKIMRADLSSQIEGLAYTWLGQNRSIEIYETLIKISQELLRRVQVLESMGRMEVGSADTFMTVVKNFEFSKASVFSSSKATQSSLSEALGFLNSEAVSNLTLDNESRPIEEALPLDKDKVVQSVLSRSLELKQMDILIQAANQTKGEIKYQWMDPQTLPSFSLGFNLITQHQTVNIDIQVAILKQAQIQQHLIHKASSLASRYNSTLRAFREAVEFKELQHKRVKQIIKEIQNANLKERSTERLSTRSFEVQAIFQDYLSSILLAEGYRTSFRIIRGQIERLLLIGHYLPFLANKAGLNMLTLFEEKKVNLENLVPFPDENHSDGKWIRQYQLPL